ncbi:MULTISPECIES: hypothetical protein [Pseudomonas aeruginosa group]|uniref:hypothetical protein n=1 Tax=Pseudomonas aeruginosa group TaxID=136841 RepID=UPI000F4E0C25|nr:MULTISPECIES: hypothetical protein [Pseudomonas aeruginosa group]MCT9627849.1 hypothetical protein [Pseudomonas aeruginosa]MCW8027381.1 hypothetical protein [Pseudomonas aeruginosa]MCW8035142.1 hypothetical protein [Pseudomonas aeruginosa]MDY1577190.1 hypothetical protein [Pseudomonas paraeruginosa]HBO7427156.1 hypothetical protein [Pseudomonas aeruginosa]
MTWSASMPRRYPEILRSVLRSRASTGMTWIRLDRQCPRATPSLAQHVHPPVTPGAAGMEKRQLLSATRSWRT